MKKWTNHFVCQRSGRVFPMSQLVIEPGTGLRVARKFSDGANSINRHPQNFPPQKRREGVPLRHIRRDTHIDETYYIVDDHYCIIVDGLGNALIYD